MGMMDKYTTDLYDDSPGVEILGISDLKLLIEEESNQMSLLDEQPQVFLDAVTSYVTGQFRINKEAKRRSGIEEMITQASEQYNGEYSAKELAAITKQGGSDLFMNITATKCRAAASWIRDIELATNLKSWTIRPTPIPDLPADVKATIAGAISKEFEALVVETRAKEVEQSKAEGQNAPSPPKASDAQDTIREINQNKRDIEEAIFQELQKEAEFDMKVMERQINDQLIEGKWYEAFSQFIDDFVVYPSAFMKGPIVTRSTKMTYLNGIMVPSPHEYCYKNRRVSPYDMYPAPEATSLYDGALCEHLRFTGLELNDLLSVGTDYKSENIVKVLEEGPMDVYDYLDSGIEQEKADQEKRGDTFDANQNIYHGIHFFGPIKARILKDWGVQDLEVLSANDWVEFECEVIVVGNHTIKCILNQDPMLRRPYYTASYQQRPGSVWGRSLPDLMRDIQRMCNATARALANNMALAAGPQIEVYVERIADMSDLEDIYPFKIWQLNVDPTGAGGRGINFFQPTSNANELLTVYKEFELRADDATGIPRYAYGNENSGQAAATFSGLSVLLESASKGIKDAIRNIDSGVIIPRIEHQFYMNIIDNKVPYTGDPHVDALGSSTLTLKGAEQIKRNEFLQITANPIDQEIMGAEGRAALLREMAKDLGFIEDIVPTRLDMKKREKVAEGRQAQAQQAAQQEKQAEQQASLQATSIQVQGQQQMNELTQTVKAQAEQLRDQRKAIDQQLKALDLQLKEQSIKQQGEIAASSQKNDMDKQTREIALKLQEGEGI
jgi:hypothetical protein